MRDKVMVSDGISVYREATSEEIQKAVPGKTHRLSTFDLVELENGVYLRSWGDGRYTLENDDRISYARVYKQQGNTCSHVGYVRDSELS